MRVNCNNTESSKKAKLYKMISAKSKTKSLKINQFKII